MRPFVMFLFTSYLLAMGVLTHSLIMFTKALNYGLLPPLQSWQVILIILLLLASIPTYYLMTADDSSFSKRWVAFFVCIVCKVSAIFIFCHPVEKFSQGILFGISGVLGILWLAIGSMMITRYCSLIQRGWTEKEKVSRRRARRRYEI